MNRKKGFTLVEVLISTAILVSVFGVMAYGISQCSGVREIARNSDIALNAAQEKLEEIADSDMNTIVDIYNGTTFSVPGLSPGGISYANRISGTDLYDVSATVSWYQSDAQLISRTITTTFVQK